MSPRPRPEEAAVDCPDGLPALLGELARSAVATLRCSDDGLHHHAPLLRAAGASTAQLAALQQLPAIDQRLWSPLQRATLALCVQMCGTSPVSNAVFEDLRQALGDDEQLFGLVGIIASQDRMARALAGCERRIDN